MRWQLQSQIRQRGKIAQEVVDALKKEERAGGRGRRWRGALRRTQAQLADLEHDGAAVELVFPQVRAHARACRQHLPGMSRSGSPPWGSDCAHAADVARAHANIQFRRPADSSLALVP